MDVVAIYIRTNKDKLRVPTIHSEIFFNAFKIGVFTGMLKITVLTKPISYVYKYKISPTFVITYWDSLVNIQPL